MTGLRLSGKARETMTRRRFVWDRELDTLVEVSPDYEQPGRNDARDSFTSDSIYDGLHATDGSDISTRTKHREYMRKHGLTTADDFKETWKQDEARRNDYRTGKRGTVTKYDVGRAIHQLETNERKRKS